MPMQLTLLEQCQRWHDEDQFQAIIDAIETLPAAARTPELDMELARAYNNRCVMDFDGTKPELLHKAIDLLKAHEARFTGDHKWHFRLGYAYYYLDLEPLALPQFRAALQALPDDEDTQMMIVLCERSFSRPV